MSWVGTYPPIMQSTKMIGARMVKGSLNTQMKAGMKAMLMISENRLAEYRLAIRPQTKSGWSTNTRGPGSSPHITIPPSRMAVVGEPGMPRVSMGSMEPVEAALLAHSGATTPSTLPLPKLSGSLAICLATP